METTIRLNIQTKQDLDKFKQYKNESYNDDGFIIQLPEDFFFIHLGDHIPWRSRYFMYGRQNFHTPVIDALENALVSQQGLNGRNTFVGHRKEQAHFWIIHVSEVIQKSDAVVFFP